MEVMIKGGKYYTKNVYLAATLDFHGFVIECEPSVREQGRFDFCTKVSVHNQGELERIVNGFFEETLAVEPRAFGASVKNVKDRLYNAKEQDAR